jgi:tetratricopeptide (TPR) repeat protein
LDTVSKLLKKIGVVLLLAPSCISAANGPYERLVDEGIQHAYNMEVEQATQAFNRLIEMDPHNPQGYVLQSVNYFYQTQFQEDNEDAKKQFKKHTGDAVKYAKKRLASEQYGRDALFYLGTVNMYLAAHHGDQNNWLKSYWYGKEGIKYLEKVIEIDPNYNDAYFGLGLYHYYADVMPRFLKVVTSFLGIEGDRKKGLHELELAAEKGRYTRAEAIFFLSVVHSSLEREYEKAVGYTQRLLDLYPMNRGFLTLHGENLRDAGKHEAAVEIFNRLLALDNASYPVFDVFSNYSLGNLFFELNGFETAMVYYNKAVALAEQRPEAMNWALAWSRLKLGESYEALGHREQAVGFFKKVKKSHSKRAFKTARKRLKEPFSEFDLDILLAKNHLKRKQYDQTIEILEMALTKADGLNGDELRAWVPEAHYYIGKALYEKKAYQPAVDKLTKVVGMEVEEDWVKPWAHYYLGKCFQDMGKMQMALDEFDKAYDYKDNALRFDIDKIRDALTNDIVKN